jgi:hypothetical protein
VQATAGKLRLAGVFIMVLAASSFGMLPIVSARNEFDRLNTRHFPRLLAAKSAWTQ